MFSALSIKKFFPTVSAQEHSASNTALMAQMEADKAKQILKDTQFVGSIEDNSRKRLISAVYNVQKHAENGTPEEIIDEMQEEINMMLDPDYDMVNFQVFCDSPSKYTGRPLSWRVVAEEWFKGAGVERLKKEFPELLTDKYGNLVKDECIRGRLRRWSADLQREKKAGIQLSTRHGGKAPAYGNDIDQMLLNQLKIRMESSLPVDNDVARELLLPLLHEHSLTHILKERGGYCSFGQAWANRFFKRHQLPFRAATTKAREFPADFAEKEENFINILSAAVVKYSVPPALVLNMDETNVQFVSNPKKTRAIKGSKRVRLQGIGKEKAQITVTLAVSETGDVLPPQFIFGGKTTKCHPSVPAPAGGYYTHSTTHWQTPATFAEWIQRIVVPFRDVTIKEKGFHATQKMILLLDLHYSHKDLNVSLKIMEENNIIPVFIPAGCTDVMQVLDVCCNKPFKAAVKKAFRDFAHLEFKRWTDAGNVPESFLLPVKISQLKPQLPSFVGKGVEALSTLAAKESIQKCFQKEGRLEVARSPQQMARSQASLGLVLRLVVPAGEEKDSFSDSEDDSVTEN
jgi:hypothetical protein